MTEFKRSIRPIDQDRFTSVASKRQQVDMPMSSKERKEKLGEKITTLQQLVSPYGKTDTASVLLEAMEYIKFLHEQVKVLSTPYLLNTPVTNLEDPLHYSLRSKGLCLVPIESTAGLAGSNGADIWAPIKTGSPSMTVIADLNFQNPVLDFNVEVVADDNNDTADSNFNCVILEGVETDVQCQSVSYVESDKSKLIHMELLSDEAAFVLYNGYAYKHGFAVMKGNLLYRLGENNCKEVSIREVFCHRSGMKRNRTGVGNQYTKTEYRTNCPARLRLHVDKCGKFVVIKHVMVHNHVMILLEKRHLLRMHRGFI